MSQSRRKSMLVSWIMSNVEEWEDFRDTNYAEKFKEYYRLWRGIWTRGDKTRETERSKLISPALQQAVEATVAELEESTFGRGRVWFDIEDDVLDDMKEDLISVRNILIEDMEKAEVPAELSKVFLYGALYGTGIGKIMVEEVTERKISAKAVSSILGTSYEAESTATPGVRIRLEAIHPLNFAIDPAARNIDEALGCAHIMLKPTHTITKKQSDGVYYDVPIGSFDSTEDINNTDENRTVVGKKTKIVEYHGLVPAALLDFSEEDDPLYMELFGKGDKQEADGTTTFDIDEDDLIEAIVTIANDSVLLRAIDNPNVMKDRNFIAYQHDTVPNAFWGRGVAEKGYNPQKALDAELRSRMDAMALITHPMMAADATRLPRGQRMTVSPGKVFLTNGDPSSVFMPFKFGSLDSYSFAQTGDLERQIQMATGAMDSAAPTSINPRNQTASGMSMMTAGMLKRQKRSKNNIDRCFINPLIEKTLWRQMQFNQERYPIGDYKFVTKSSMGLMAREYEQTQLTQLLSIIPQDSPVFMVILQGILDNSSVENKAELIKAMQQWSTPDPQQQQQQQQMQQIQLENLMLENEKLKSEIFENYANGQSKGAKVQSDMFNAETNRLNAVTNAQKETVSE